MTSTLSHVPAPGPAAPLPPEFEALSRLVNQARQGEIRLNGPGEPPPGRLPSGWYDGKNAPAPSPHSEWRAAGWGLATGLVLLVPTILFLRDAPSPRENRPAAAAIVQPVAAPSAPVRDSTFADAQPMSAAEIVADVEVAERLVASGDVIAARTALAKAAGAKSPRALFLMAETYDPNLLAAWGTRGVNADATQARALYAAANALGHPLAEVRLKGLE